jgi:preprotein translocase subunit SecA
MFNTLFRSLFGSRNDRLVKRLRMKVAAINALEPAMQVLSDSALAAKTTEFKNRLANGETENDLLIEAFAVVRETAHRVLGERHYDVQLIGGMALHEGRIPEMRTGEGKTLVSTLPAYLNALSGKGVHVVTVNDYLAKRDAEWMGRVFNFLGMSVGIIQSNISDEERRAAYVCDITYSTNNELGFDYLRDNMKYSANELVQRPFNYAIIDEVDSILIDEARTPLIISGPAEDSTDMYKRVDALIPQLDDAADIERDEKSKNVMLTDAGVEHMEELLRGIGLLESGGLYDVHNMAALHHTNQALRAHKAYNRDKEYIIKDGKVILVDEFTGRMMTGRRFSDGLHQALEAKEKVTIQRENQTLASITFQNFFRMYPKMAGMTGTAMTEAGEFGEIYNLDVVDIPTHRPVARKDEDDEIYRTEAEKIRAIVKLVKEAHARKQPILVGTTSIEKSEILSENLKKEHIPHNILNARHHEQEAFIVAQAGRAGAVTVATNMAGRGTDIKLGGNAEMMVKQQLKGDETPEQIIALTEKVRAQVAQERDIVLQAGGLLVIGTERHESRRIDNQLRGRSGRQGDPGASKFYISLQDDLMRIFGAERIDSVLQRLGIPEGQAIFHPWISTAIERAQKKVEGQHFDARRHLLRFDNVMNDQRTVIYNQRRKLMNQENVSELIDEMIEDAVLGAVERNIPENSYQEKWDLTGLAEDLKTLSSLELPLEAWAKEEGVGDQEMADKILAAMQTHWTAKRENFIASIENHPSVFGLDENADPNFRTQFATTLFTDLERNVILQFLDKVWKEHLLNLDHLRMGINLRGYAQRDPLNEYKSEAFMLFKAMMDDYRAGVAQAVLNLAVTTSSELDQLRRPKKTEMKETRIDPALQESLSEGNVVGFPDNRQGTAIPMKRVKLDVNDPTTWAANVSRNADCPCGSGKKYKHCHGSVSGAVGKAAQPV